MTQPIRMGIAGLGTATRQMLPAFLANANILVSAAATRSEEKRNAFQQDYGVPVFADAEQLCRFDGIDAVYIATPTELHTQQIHLALDSGKHVLVEKPMAVTLEEARGIVEKAQQSGLAVIVGHSHSFDPPIQAIKDVLDSGRLGPVRMIHNWNYNDWLYRPRTKEELDTTQGGGVTFRQGSHQFDIIRYLGGGVVRSVRAMTGRWDPARPTEGSHVAYLEFENGLAATAVYNGYDHFHTSELTWDIGEWGGQARRADDSHYGMSRKRVKGISETEEMSLKQKRSQYQNPASDHGPIHSPFFGLTVVSCDHGDIRQSPNGLLIYSDEEVEEITLNRVPTAHDLVVREFVEAVRKRDDASTHDAEWGLANLEVCLAVLESAERREEVLLKHQVPW
ncbi:Gfo/Idh/MocA family oxidoreductase [Alicyclobacillus fastidiosus]|uniref:Gfo/Idh/MocA family oxidoreductase n=2 Tax=Alicyclobacillus fastidiosus TaxID=392011 RepID=A0ABY6ZGJ2_9BACL|nr:Gfo/Idh/MocA family oxidoreductase [Alicyclobacillus fastidiosus]WAH41617.1 Gfo/Idh/MocA family oxidoreductase [Alicyclobacillus fastidiosus]